MKIYRLYKNQCLSISLQEAWDFFSDPRNLEQITPGWLNFHITSHVPDKIYAGTILTYRMKAYWMIPFTWVTEITHVHQPYFFVDEQRFGPYRFWHHQHIFRETDRGVEMEDIVHYALSFGRVGRTVNHLLVKSKVNEIFEYRKKMLSKIFGEGK